MKYILIVFCLINISLAEWTNDDTLQVKNFNNQYYVDIKSKADLGDSEAQHELGTIYEMGVIVPENYIEALKWYKLSAENGNIVTQKLLGFMYMFGQNIYMTVPINENESVKWYRLAAEQGDVSAQNLLGALYLIGAGKIDMDREEAFKWYKLAAEQGDLKAQEALKKF